MLFEGFPDDASSGLIEFFFCSFPEEEFIDIGLYLQLMREQVGDILFLLKTVHSEEYRHDSRE